MSAIGRILEPPPTSPLPQSSSRSSAAAGPRRTEASMSHRGEYRVSVTKDYLVFASAHFITFSGHRCETLHGHNYRVSVVVEGTLDPESWYVLDFGELKRIMRKLCDDIDHKVLLAVENPHLQIAEQGDSVTVAYDGAPRYVSVSYTHLRAHETPEHLVCRL